MNPPTIGHGKVFDELAKKSGKNDYKVFLSQQTNEKNILNLKNFYDENNVECLIFSFNKNFEEIIDFYESKNFEIVSLDNFIESQRQGNLNKKVVFTFDDGYKDHIDFVLPELLKRGIKVSFFIKNSTPIPSKPPSIGSDIAFISSGVR